MKIKTTSVVIIFLFVTALSVIGTLISLGGNAGITNSFQGSQVIYTKPNVTDFQTILQSQNINVPKFSINIQSVVVDSNHKPQQPVSSYLNLNDLITNTLVGPNGVPLDQGSIQTQLFGVTDSNKQVILSGLISVYLDKNMIKQGRITGQGMTVNNNIPLLVDGNSTLNFTLADEGANWINGSKHTYSIYLSNVQATVGTGTNTQTFSYMGQFLAYILNMQLDNSKKITTNVNGDTVSIYKSDDALTGILKDTRVIDKYVYYEGTPTMPIIKVYQNGFLIGSTSNTGGTINNIPRNQIITINVDGTDYQVKTPTTQFTYNVSCTTNYVVTGDNPDSTIYGLSSVPCTSNFGYSR